MGDTVRESGARPRVWALAVVAALLPLCLLEGATRALADRLPTPDEWGTPEIPYKLSIIPDEGSDILILGSSVTDVGVDPSLLDELNPSSRGAFNGSLGAGTLEMVGLMAEQVWLPRLMPELVVVGVVTRDTNANDPRQLANEARFFSSMRVRALTGDQSLADRADRWLADTFAAWRHRAELRSADNLFGRGSFWGDAQTAPDGQYLEFADGHYEASPEQDEFIRTGPLADWEVSRSRLDMIESVVVAARDTGARVLLLLMPTTQDYVSLHPNGEQDVSSFREAVTSLAARLDVAVEDFGVWPDTAFADVVHLNRAGAEELTRQLAETTSILLVGAN